MMKSYLYLNTLQEATLPFRNIRETLLGWNVSVTSLLKIFFICGRKMKTSEYSEPSNYISECWLEWRYNHEGGITCLSAFCFWYIWIYLQLNIAYPATGCQKFIEIDDEKRLYVLSYFVVISVMCWTQPMRVRQENLSGSVWWWAWRRVRRIREFILQYFDNL